MVGKAQDRELIEPNQGDKRYIRRNDNGEFTKQQVDVGKSPSSDNNQQAKKTVRKGQGDKGDHRG